MNKHVTKGFNSGTDQNMWRFVSKINNNLSENQKLTELRDWLLPM